jgi:hypothetical protein
MPDDNTDPPAFVLNIDDRTVPPLVAVRQWSTDAAAELGEDHFTAVQLVAVELVTNAYQHGGGARQIRLRRERHPCRVHIEVDDNSTHPPIQRHPDTHPPGGRGLLLVAKLCTQWGSSPRAGGGKTVWATVDCSTYPWGPCPVAAVARADFRTWSVTDGLHRRPIVHRRIGVPNPDKYLFDSATDHNRFTRTVAFVHHRPTNRCQHGPRTVPLAMFVVLAASAVVACQPTVLPPAFPDGAAGDNPPAVNRSIR